MRSPAIAQKLELKLSGNDAKGITKRYTDSNEAYQLWLKGRYSFAKRTKDGHLQAIGYFRQAINLDPKFALAYARLAETYGSIAFYPYLSPKAFLRPRLRRKKLLRLTLHWLRPTRFWRTPGDLRLELGGSRALTSNAQSNLIQIIPPRISVTDRYISRRGDALMKPLLK